MYISYAGARRAAYGNVAIQSTTPNLHEFSLHIHTKTIYIQKL